MLLVIFLSFHLNSDISFLSQIMPDVKKMDEMVALAYNS